MYDVDERSTVTHMASPCNKFRAPVVIDSRVHSLCTLLSMDKFRALPAAGPDEIILWRNGTTLSQAKLSAFRKGVNSHFCGILSDSKVSEVN